MATKKQRRRREKEKRHEYVWVDDEGNEISHEDAPSGRSSPAPSPRQAAGRAGRTVQPPSWRRSLKRGAIFAPIMLATVMLLSNDLTLAQQVTQALFIVSVFIPFSYFLDRVFYRSFLKRQAKTSAGSRPRG